MKISNYQDREVTPEQVTSDYIDIDTPDERIKEVTKVSLNPLPPERLLRSSEEREKSSEPSAKVDAEEDDDESAGSCGDIEDNLDDTNKMDVSINIQVI